MGEVYRATDTKLNRDVALKILPQQFASDSQRMGRFQREAEVLASLDHPNIGQIFGIEEAGQTKALVLQLIEGPTLAERIVQGPIPVEETLKIALQIAEGLEAAHEKGVIHRDLKPANVKITPEGQVKILDFGLAKAMEVKVPDSSLSQSPTLTNAATQAGVILGTAAYMSPEQAKGQAVDKRADIWAFGAVPYEMLTGKRAYQGENVSDTLASILKSAPDWEELPLGLPDSLRRVLDRCIQKDTSRRQRDAGDIRLDLQAALLEEAAGPPSELSLSQRIVGWAPSLVAAALIVVVLGFVVWGPTPSETAPSIRRFPLDLPWQNMPNLGDFRVRISPQGTHLAYPGSDENRTTINLRPFDSLEPVTLVSPSADPWNLAFSPEGEQLAFFTNRRQLRTVSIRGGQPEGLFELPAELFPEGLSWGSDGSILVGGNSGLTRVPTSGGESELVAAADESDIYRFPFSLPDGDHAFVSIARPAESPRLAVVDLGSGTIGELPFQGKNRSIRPLDTFCFAKGEDCLRRASISTRSRYRDRPWRLQAALPMGLVCPKMGRWFTLPNGWKAPPDWSGSIDRVFQFRSLASVVTTLTLTFPQMEREPCSTSLTRIFTHMTSTGEVSTSSPATYLPGPRCFPCGIQIMNAQRLDKARQSTQR